MLVATKAEAGHDLWDVRSFIMKLLAEMAKIKKFLKLRYAVIYYCEQTEINFIIGLNLGHDVRI